MKSVGPLLGEEKVSDATMRVTSRNFTAKTRVRLGVVVQDSSGGSNTAVVCSAGGIEGGKMLYVQESLTKKAVCASLVGSSARLQWDVEWGEWKEVGGGGG